MKDTDTLPIVDSFSRLSFPLLAYQFTFTFECSFEACDQSESGHV